MEYIIAYDLGTGGIKAALFDRDLKSCASVFIHYDTYYPENGWHEQKPMDWWKAVCDSTHLLLDKSKVDAQNILAAALSGHSLVCAPVGSSGELLLSSVPIWSDTRASDMTEGFFSNIPYNEWYMMTGNGDPPECYSVFKLLWLKKHMPEVFEKTAAVLGSKDFINYMLTGNMATDPSYASGTGLFDLLGWRYSDTLMKISGLSEGIFHEILPSHAIVGKVTGKAAAATGLSPGTPVACGGVDNSCMALGARGIEEGSVYTSLGSSSWIAVTSKKPVLDPEKHPFIFAHIEEGFYTSATSIFSAGSSLNWIRDLFPEAYENKDAYAVLNEWASKSPVGSNGVIFNPSLAGGSAQEKSPDIRGGFSGLSLSSSRQDIVRSCFEGVAFDLKMCLDCLSEYVHIGNEMLMTGGGSKSPLWMQIFADVFNMRIVKTNIDQETASLGAAMIAARSCGLRDNYSIEGIHKVEKVYEPDPVNVAKYKELYKVSLSFSEFLSRSGSDMKALHNKGVW